MYDEGLAQRIRGALAEQPELSERKMFGGIAFMLRGHMCCGVMDDRLMVRLGAEQYGAALALPHARPAELGGRPMTGMVIVEAPGLESDAALVAWVDRGVQFASSLPPKEAKKRATAARAPRADNATRRSSRALGTEPRSQRAAS